MDIAALAEELKKKISNTNKYEWEIYISESKGASLAWSEGALEEKQYAQNGGFGVRLLSDGRQGFSSTNKLDANEFSAVWNEAEAMLPFMPEDRIRKLPEPVSIQEENLGTYDPVAAQLDMQGKEAILADMEKTLLGIDARIKKAYRIDWDQGVGSMLMFNSKGAFLSRQGTSCSASIECVAEEAGDTQVGSFMQSKRFLEDLTWQDLPAQAGAVTLDQLAGSSIPSGRMAVIFEPWVMMEFLSLVASSVCADNVQKGKSLYKGKLGQQVASDSINIIDDARMKRGIESSLFDDDGLPTRTVPVIVEGVLKTFLYDSYTATKDKTESTGSARRPSFRGMPEPGTSNLYIQPGTTSRDEIIKTTKKGLRIISLMGMHTADPITGDFSVGAVGTLIENGKFTKAVRGVTIAGNIVDVMKNIEAVGNDLIFLGSSGSPTVKVKSLMIGGS